MAVVHVNPNLHQTHPFYLHFAVYPIYVTVMMGYSKIIIWSAILTPKIRKSNERLTIHWEWAGLYFGTQEVGNRKGFGNRWSRPYNEGNEMTAKYKETKESGTNQKQNIQKWKRIKDPKSRDGMTQGIMAEKWQ